MKPGPQVHVGTRAPRRREHAWSFRLLGRFTVSWGDRPIRLEKPKLQEILSHLLLRSGPHHREILAELVWPEAPPEASRKYLRHALWQVQASLGGERSRRLLLEIDPHWVQLNQQARIWVDHHELEDAFLTVRGIRGEELDEEGAERVRIAATLYKGELLEGWYQDWCLRERERARTMYLSLLDKLLGFCEVRGHYEEGISYGETLLRHDRAHERTHVRLMRLHYLAGDRTRTLRQFEACAAALGEDLGVEPAEETRRLQDSIKNEKVILLDPAKMADITI